MLTIRGGSAAPLRPRPAPRSQAYDVSRVRADQLQRLGLGTEADQRLALTIQNARRVFGGLVQKGARVVVCAVEANGGEPVVALVPPGFDPSRPARVWTHYHGYYSTAAAPEDDRAGVTRNIARSFAADPQTLFVLPECRSAPTRDGEPMGRTDWSNVADITATTNSALRAAGVGSFAGQRVLSAHSGGGAALGAAMKHDDTGAGMRADALYLMDCCYGARDGWSAAHAAERWARTAARSATATYIDGNGGNDDKPGDRLRRILGQRYSERRAADHYAAARDFLAPTPFQVVQRGPAGYQPRSSD